MSRIVSKGPQKTIAGHRSEKPRYRKKPLTTSLSADPSIAGNHPLEYLGAEGPRFEPSGQSVGARSNCSPARRARGRQPPQLHPGDPLARGKVLQPFTTAGAEKSPAPQSKPHAPSSSSGSPLSGMGSGMFECSSCRGRHGPCQKKTPDEGSFCPPGGGF